ncbi:hypothetical protein K523DRAFT_302420 [Schizophyllum commune Tattone D]|nr:hypothetical protein K523DRAFT_302420 [Schizophyllum commune Tattone D]
MPSRSARNQAAEALEQAFIIDWIAELERHSLDYVDDWDSDDDSNSSDILGGSSSSSSSSSDDSDIDMSDEEPTAAEAYMKKMEELYSRRYLQERQNIPKSSELLHNLLYDYKVNRPEIFRSYLRISPACFDALLAVIEDDPVFHNNSNNSQMPVAHQLAIALYRFGHHGNAASGLKVALLFGVGYGTINLFTSRVIKAVCGERFRTAALQWPDDAEKEKAKDWVERTSCPAWRDGWLMVDGTLIPLFRRPGHFGNTFYDRKSNYSLNVQLVSTPDCMIIDYAIGLPGDGLVHSPKNCAASRLAEPHHPQHNHTIYNRQRFRRVTEFDVFLLLGDSATTSNVAVGLVRGPRRASDELDRREKMQTSR